MTKPRLRARLHTDDDSLEAKANRTREDMVERIDRLARYAAQCSPEDRRVFLDGLLAGEAERAMMDGETEAAARREAQSIREAVSALVAIRLGKDR